MSSPAARGLKGKKQAKQYSWRFIHLTFQEFFVARRLLTLTRKELEARGPPCMPPTFI